VSTTGTICAEARAPRPADDGRGRAHGFVSAVLLLVLLATTGLGAEVGPRDRAAGGHVTCCDADYAVAVARAAERAQIAARPVLIAAANAAPRPAHRQRRIDSGGLPPPRAPTA
jgi:hypothetical protein